MLFRSLAGVPEATVQLARKLLAQLEAQSSATRPQLGLFDAPPATGDTTAPFLDGHGDAAQAGAIVARLEAVDPDALSPRDAHALLYELIAQLRSGATD